MEQKDMAESTKQVMGLRGDEKWASGMSVEKECGFFCYQTVPSRLHDQFSSSDSLSLRCRLRSPRTAMRAFEIASIMSGSFIVGCLLTGFD